MSIYRPTPVQRENGNDNTPRPVDPDRGPATLVVRRRWPAAVAAVAILVSACGTDSTNDDASARGDGASVAASSGDEGDAAAPADDAAAEPADEGEGAPESASEPATEVAAAAVNVPAVEVLDVADGSVINLAEELAGEDRAILFWFWAPH